MDIDPSRLTYVRRIARGAFGDVHLAVYEGRDVAVKMIREMPGAQMELRFKLFLEERDLLRSLHHPHIVKYVGSYVPAGATTWREARRQSSHAPCLVSEACGGGSLATCLENAGKGSRSWEGPVIPLDDVYRASEEIASALAYLHSKGYVHRDVKSDNVFVEVDGTTRLGDFGLAVQEDRVVVGRSGSCRWMAPEVCRGEPYGMPADVFSFGVLVTELVSGQMPHSHLSGEAVADLTACGLRARIPSHCPSDLRGLLRSCFREDPRLRPRAADLVADLGEMRMSFHRKKQRGSVDIPSPNKFMVTRRRQSDSGAVGSAARVQEFE
jgi:serine/threonine protein kinase